jgi:hypothetical protein
MMFCSRCSASGPATDDYAAIVEKGDEWAWAFSCIQGRPLRKPTALARQAIHDRSKGMAQTFDLILKGGTVVNHDGSGLRDVGDHRRPDRRYRRPFPCQRPAR